jgi:Ala-tRNA(Pro) deacylase
MPPFGNLYDVPVYVDQELAHVEESVSHASTHEGAMRVAYADFRRLVQPTLGMLACLP